MLFEILFEDMILREAELVAWTINITLKVVIGVMIFANLYNTPKEEIDQRKMTILWALYLLLFAVGHSIGLWVRLYCPFDLPTETCWHFDKIAIIIDEIAVLLVIYDMERRLELYKYPVVSVVLIVGIILLIIDPTPKIMSPLTWSHFLIFIFTYAYIPLMYLYVALKFGGPFKKRSLVIFLAFTLMGIGTAFQRQNVVAVFPGLVEWFEVGLNIPWVYLCTFTANIGIVLFYYGYKMESLA